MTVNYKIKYEKLHYDINGEAAKISALSSGKLINMNILQVKKYNLLIKKEWWNKLSYLFFFKKNFWKTNKNDWKSEGKTNKSNWWK